VHNILVRHCYSYQEQNTKSTLAWIRTHTTTKFWPHILIPFYGLHLLCDVTAVFFARPKKINPSQQQIHNKIHIRKNSSHLSRCLWKAQDITSTTQKKNTRTTATTTTTTVTTTIWEKEWIIANMPQIISNEMWVYLWFIPPKKKKAGKSEGVKEEDGSMSTNKPFSNR